jgi:hypothetical protein
MCKSTTLPLVLFALLLAACNLQTTTVEPQPGPFTATIYYENGFPSGVIQISVTSLDIVIRDPWQTTWQP